MHLNNSIGRHPGLETIFNHHEQACAMAADSYARLTGKAAAVCVTSGPGGTNALTGVLGAWLDSLPMIVVSGQVRYDTTVRSTGLPLRQLGDQEYDIVRSAAPMTKYSVMVTEPAEIRYHLERALHLALSGRPGPVWIDIPLNVQGASIESEHLRSYDPADPAEDSGEISPIVPEEAIKEIIYRIRKAERPVLLAGSAVRSSGGHEDFLRLAGRLNIPVVTAWNAHDCLPDDHPLYFGRPGTVGDRAGNFIVQNADLLLVLGCRLNIRQIGYNMATFAREAFKIIVDIDPVELMKPTVKADLPLQADVADVIASLVEMLPEEGLPFNEEWFAWCRDRRERYPVVLPEYWERAELVNPYCFVETLFRRLQEDQIIVAGNGSACVCTFQAARIKKGQRLYTNSGCAPMGYDLPAAIGACIGSGRKKVVCLAGDGSIQMNLQELQTIRHYCLPIKIFVLNNAGYHSIRQTQLNYFKSPLVGCDEESGISFPDMGKLAEVYEMPFNRCRSHKDLDSCVVKCLEADGPSICEVMLTPGQGFAPRAASRCLPDGRIVSAPLEDLYPFLERREFLMNMLIPPLETSLE